MTVRWMAHFPPGKGVGEGVTYGRKGKGIVIHSLTDGAGMPLSTHTTPANGDERAQVMPLLDALHIRTGKRADRGNASRCWRRIRDMMLKTSVIASAHAGSGPRFLNGCGRAASCGGADQTGYPSLPSRADICLVPTQVSPLGRALGTYRCLLYRVSCYCHDSHVGP
jgi:hypothetical protein